MDIKATNLDNSKVNIIYGHMSNSSATPFTQLEKYFSHNYQDIEIIGENSNYHYEVFSVFKVKKQETRHLKVYFNVIICYNAGAQCKTN